MRSIYFSERAIVMAEDLLSETDFAIFYKYVIDGLGYEEIAHLLDLAEWDVKSRIVAAVRTLRNYCSSGQVTTFRNESLHLATKNLFWPNFGGMVTSSHFHDFNPF